MLAVRPDQLELGEAIPAGGRALIMMYLTQAFACGSKAGALPQDFERMGFINAGLLSARHAAFYTPDCVEAQALSGCLLYDRGMVAEALYEIAFALIQRRNCSPS